MNKKKSKKNKPQKSKDATTRSVISADIPTSNKGEFNYKNGGLEIVGKDIDKDARIMLYVDWIVGHILKLTIIGIIIFLLLNKQFYGSLIACFTIKENIQWVSTLIKKAIP